MENETDKNQGLYKKLALSVLVIILLVVIYTITTNTRQKLNHLTTLNKLSGTELKVSEGYTHILLSGLDTREKQEVGSLTDSLIVLSLSKERSRAVLTSIPRDIWVEVDGKGMKINSVMRESSSNIDSLLKSIFNISGIKPDYYLFVDFKSFVKFIDQIGGIEVDVKSGFDDYKYPVEGEENNPILTERYKHVHFDQGIQNMNGETALIFSRSRHGLGGEGSDFARSERQKLVMLAIQKKLLSSEFILNPENISKIYTLFSENIITNLSLSEIQLLSDMALNDNFKSINSISLNGPDPKVPLFYDSNDFTKYSGKAVLVPVGENFEKVKAYVDSILYQ